MTNKIKYSDIINFEERVISRLKAQGGGTYTYNGKPYTVYSSGEVYSDSLEDLTFDDCFSDPIE